MLNQNSFYIDISRINTAHEFVLDKNNKCSYPNGRNCYGVIYCISGEARYSFYSGNHCTLCPGNILLLSPSAAYSISTKGEFRHYTVNFEIHGEASDIVFFKNGFYLLCVENHDLYRHIFKKLTAHWNLRKNGFEMLAVSCLYELVALLISEISEKEYRTSSYMRMHPAREYIEQNFNSGINLDVLANCVNMSVTHFRREWLKLYGESALQYRDRLRISYAKEYLLTGYYTVSEVALKCGFDDVNYFIRFFKKHTGISPGKFGESFS